MSWTLFFCGLTAWYFFSVHMLFEKRYEQASLHLAGQRAEKPGLLKASKILTHLVILNFAVFLFVYGFSISWLDSIFVVVGSYIGSLVLILITRGPLADALLWVNHCIGWIALPASSAALWYLAFY